MSEGIIKNGKASDRAGSFDKVIDTILNKNSQNPIANAPVATKLEEHDNAISQINSDIVHFIHLQLEQNHTKFNITYRYGSREVCALVF